MTQTKTSKTTPTLRFPEFSGAWEEKKLGEAFDFLKTNSFSRNLLNYKNGKVKNIHYGDIHMKFNTSFDLKREHVPFINEDLNLSQFKEEEYCKKGDIIVADASEDRQDVGKAIEIVNLNNEKLLSGLHTLLLRKKGNKFATGFSGRLLKSRKVRLQIMRIATGASILGISKNSISKISLDFPSLPEQQKIAEFLGAVDEWVGNLRTEEAALLKYKKGIMQKIFPKKAGEAPEIRFKPARRIAGEGGAENGNSFSDWEEKKLGEVADLKNGYTFKSSNHKLSGKYRVVTIGNVQKGKLSISQGSKIEILPLDIQKHQILKKLDMLVSMTGNVGRVCMVDTDNCLLNQRVGKIVVKENTNLFFLYQWLIGDEFEYRMQSLAQGGAQGNISKGDILGYSFLLPSLTEQKKIVAELVALSEKVTRLKDLQKSQAEDLKNLEQAYLREAFTFDE